MSPVLSLLSDIHSKNDSVQMICAPEKCPQMYKKGKICYY